MDWCSTVMMIGSTRAARPSRRRNEPEGARRKIWGITQLTEPSVSSETGRRRNSEGGRERERRKQEPEQKPSELRGLNRAERVGCERFPVDKCLSKASVRNLWSVVSGFCFDERQSRARALEIGARRPVSEVEEIRFEIGYHKNQGGFGISGMRK